MVTYVYTCTLYYLDAVNTRTLQKQIFTRVLSYYGYSNYAIDVLMYCTYMQVDRRVVNQLASAFEQGLLTRESGVRLVVGGEGEGEGVTIKLVVTEKSGRDHEVNVGCVGYPLDNSEPLF